jgi:hypothetical protein
VRFSRSVDAYSEDLEGEEMKTDQASRHAAFDFEGRMSRQTLERFLSRTITMSQMLRGNGYLDDNLRMLKHIGGKFVGRALYHWGEERSLGDSLSIGKTIAQRLHALDPQVILQAGIFECVTPQVNGMPIPGWVFEAFSVKAEARCFKVADMVFEDGSYVNHWGPGASVPDISRLETRMWFFHLAASYIDMGVEALHFGQIMLIGRNDPEMRWWWETLSLVRRYAARHARRRFVLCDAHVSSGVGCYGLTYDPTTVPAGFRVGDKLLLDFHALPLRIKEIPDQPWKAELAMGHLDALYGRSMGGVTPSGWACDHLPYLVEFDNWGSSGHGGESVAGRIGDREGIDDRFWIWGYDEICWFAHRSEAERNGWLWYAWRWLKQHDGNGFLQMPGMRGLADPVDGIKEYYANTCSENCPQGQNQEETIKSIWNRHGRDSAPYLEKDYVKRP